MLDIPCRDLDNLDKLWMQYSKGNFGFSVQNKIYENVWGNYTEDKYTEYQQKFTNKLGWGDELIESTRKVPLGYFPTHSWTKKLGVGESWFDKVVALFSRLDDCKIKN